MSAKFCHNCINWEQVNLSTKDSSGMCDEVMVGIKVKIENQDLSDNGAIWTNGYFGCIYWRENDGSVVDFGDIIDEEGKPIDDE